ncbi:MAG: hypothetical protein RLY31_1698 [Bacteroidota bacterium]|jgi:hypothetical protein
MMRILCIVLYGLFLEFSLFGQDTLVFEDKHFVLVNTGGTTQDEVVFKRYDSGTDFVIDKYWMTEIRYQDTEKGTVKLPRKPMFLPKPMKVWIFSPVNQTELRGYLAYYDDNTLFIQRKKGMKNSTKGLKASFLYAVPYTNIHEIQVRNRKSVRLYSAIGAFSGLFLGTFVGSKFFQDDPVCEPVGPDGTTCDESLYPPLSKMQKSLALGFATSTIGFTVGGMIGGLKVSVPVAGRKEYFRAAINKLKHYSQGQ